MKRSHLATIEGSVNYVRRKPDSSWTNRRANLQDVDCLSYVIAFEGLHFGLRILQEEFISQAEVGFEQSP